MANDILQPHSDETVSKNIADHKRPLQTSVMSNGKWYNIGNTLLQMNDREDLHKVSKIVQQHQTDITNAEKAANDAHSEAQKAIDSSTVASNAASEVSAAVSDAKSTASDAHSAAVTAQSNASAALSTASGAIHSAETEIDKAKANASTALSTANAASNAASSNALEISKTSSAIALKADSSSVDVVKSQVTSTSTLASQNASELQTKANESDVDALKKTVDTHTTEIDQNSKQIALKANSSDVDEVKKTVTSQAAEISATSSEVATKASQTTVDSLAGAVSQNTASIKTNADNITSKVTRDDVSGMLKDGSYATEKYVQTTAKQTADSFNQSVVDLNGKITNVNQSLDGLRTDVKGKADQSALTQLSGVVDSKVSSKDFETERTQLSNAINDRVSKGDVISQINQEAGGNTLIQVANGKGELLLDADSTVFSGKAFIPSAAIGSVTADQVKTGKLVGDNLGIDLNTGEVEFAKGKIHSLDDNFVIDIDNEKINMTKNDLYKLGASFNRSGIEFNAGTEKKVSARIYNTIDPLKFGNLIPIDNRLGSPVSTLISNLQPGTYTLFYRTRQLDASSGQDTNTIGLKYNGALIKNLVSVKDSYTDEVTGSMIVTIDPKMADGIADAQQTDKKSGWSLSCDGHNSIFKYIALVVGSYADASVPENIRGLDDSLDNKNFDVDPTSILNIDGDSLKINVKDELNITADHLKFTAVDTTLSLGGTILRVFNASKFHNGNYLGIDDPQKELPNPVDGIWSAVNIYSDRDVGGNRLIVFDGDTTHGRFDFNENYTTYENGDAKGFWIKGTDLWVDGTVHGGGWVQTSTLSKKTNLTKLDPQTALNTINNTDIYDYQYKRDGKDGRHYASLVIDDVHEKPQTKTPEAFVSAEGDGRDDGTQLAYLTAAVQLIDQRLKKLEDKNGRK